MNSRTVELLAKIQSFYDKGWYAEKSNTCNDACFQYWLNSPRGYRYGDRYLEFNICCICADLDPDETGDICMHSDENNREQDDARTLWELIDGLPLNHIWERKVDALERLGIRRKAS